MKKLIILLLAVLLFLNLTAQDLVPYFNPISKDWGYCDWNKKSVVIAQFEEANLFYDGLAIVKDNGLYGVINPRGQFVVECKYSKIYPFNEGFAAVLSKDNKIGFIDSYGEETVPCKYNLDKYDKYRFSEGRAAVLTGNRYGYIDVTGKVVIDSKYSSARDFHDGFAIVRRPDEGYAFIGPQGNMIANMKVYSYFEDYSRASSEPPKERNRDSLTKPGKRQYPLTLRASLSSREDWHSSRTERNRCSLTKPANPL